MVQLQKGPLWGPFFLGPFFLSVPRVFASKKGVFPNIFRGFKNEENRPQGEGIKKTGVLASGVNLSCLSILGLVIFWRFSQKIHDYPQGSTKIRPNSNDQYLKRPRLDATPIAQNPKQKRKTKTQDAQKDTLDPKPPIKKRIYKPQALNTKPHNHNPTPATKLRSQTTIP